MLARPEPPRYQRASKGSMVHPHREEIAAMLAEDPKVRATVVLERLAGPAGHAIPDQEPELVIQAIEKNRECGSQLERPCS